MTAHGVYLLSVFALVPSLLLGAVLLLRVSDGQ